LQKELWYFTWTYLDFVNRQVLVFRICVIVFLRTVLTSFTRRGPYLGSELLSDCWLLLSKYMEKFIYCSKDLVPVSP
jgi:hypothetical protein